MAIKLAEMAAHLAVSESVVDFLHGPAAGQCLALHWARSHGIDPDDPRGLQKVTLTR